jgi:hypothetical protein
MHVTWYCPACLKGNGFDAASPPASPACRGCGRPAEVTISGSVRDLNVVDRCVMCGCGHLYLEKDFNGYVGFAIVLAAVVGSGILWARNVYASVAVLGAAALVDLVFWVLCRERSVCYRCVARYRGAAPNPAHGRYDLGLAGRYADDYDEQRRRRQA